VTVASMKEEQSAIREVTSGVFPARVPSTPRAQLLASHERAPWAKAKARRQDWRNIIF
jgi:hypothetical protein